MLKVPPSINLALGQVHGEKTYICNGCHSRATLGFVPPITGDECVILMMDNFPGGGQSNAPDRERGDVPSPCLCCALFVFAVNFR